jgi:LPXTG-site transpeptidase (sortase) family protein
MRRTALVLAAALALGVGAGFFVHTGMAEDADSEGAPLSRAYPRQASRLRAKPVLRRVAQRETRSAPTSLWIPRLHLKSRIFAATGLDRGPAWWPITGRPGGGDTIAVAGHRTTHSRPFYFLERLRPGDRIRIAYHGKGYAYRVAQSRVISAKNLHMADAVGDERLLLTACTPRGSARFRLVVEALPEYPAAAHRNRRSIRSRTLGTGSPS